VGTAVAIGHRLEELPLGLHRVAIETLRFRRLLHHRDLLLLQIRWWWYYKRHYLLGCEFLGGRGNQDDVVWLEGWCPF